MIHFYPIDKSEEKSSEQLLSLICGHSGDKNFYRERTVGQKHSRVGTNSKEYRRRVIPNTHTNL